MEPSSALTTLAPRPAQETPPHSPSHFCRITLIVSGVFIAVIGISLGSAALSSAIPLSRRFAIILLVGGSTLGPLLFYFGIVKKQNSPLLDPPIQEHLDSFVKEHNDHEKNVVQEIKHAFDVNNVLQRREPYPPKGWKRTLAHTKYEINSQYYQTTCVQIETELDAYTSKGQAAMVDIIQPQTAFGWPLIVHLSPLSRDD